LQRFGGPFLAGRSFTAIDACFCPVAFRVQSYRLPLSVSSAASVAKLLGLAGMREWYAAGIAEPWRDPDHEAEIAAVGVITEDFRATGPAA
jgi:glutathione S-transferase